MKTYIITFTNGLTFCTEAQDREHAQELAIDAFERAGIVIDTIASIQKV